MSSNDGAGGALGVLAGMAMLYWFAYLVAMVTLGAFVIALIVGMAVVVGLVAYLKLARNLYLSGDNRGVAILTFLPMLFGVGFLVFFLKPSIAISLITTASGKVDAHSSGETIAALCVLGMQVLGIGCVFYAPYKTYMVAKEDSSEDWTLILPATLPWLYLGLFTGFWYVFFNTDLQMLM